MENLIKEKPPEGGTVRLRIGTAIPLPGSRRSPSEDVPYRTARGSSLAASACPLRGLGAAGRCRRENGPPPGSKCVVPAAWCLKTGSMKSRSSGRRQRHAKGWGAGPPLGHEAAPNRAVLRRGLIAICATCRHGRDVWIGRNESRALSLMSAFQVKSGTREKSAAPIRLRQAQWTACGGDRPYSPPQQSQGSSCPGGRLGYAFVPVKIRTGRSSRRWRWKKLRKRFRLIGWPEFRDSRTFIVTGFGAGTGGGCLS